MTISTAFARSSGNGTNVVCLHSSLGSSKQWNRLTARLQNRYRVTATDLFGYGNSPAWESNRTLTLEDEVELMSPVLDGLRGPIHLVGHSYGAAVAMKIARNQRYDIRSLTVYEPVLFALLMGNAMTRQGADEVNAVVTAMQRDSDDGQMASATARFIDYWSGSGAWQSIHAEKQAAMTSKVDRVLANFAAAFADSGTPTQFTSLTIPVLYMVGELTPRSTQQISQILSCALPNVRMKQLASMGHMGPVTHSDIVNDHIDRFLGEQRTWQSVSPFSNAA